MIAPVTRLAYDQAARRHLAELAAAGDRRALAAKRTLERWRAARTPAERRFHRRAFERRLRALDPATKETA